MVGNRLRLRLVDRRQRQLETKVTVRTLAIAHLAHEESGGADLKNLVLLAPRFTSNAQRLGAP